VLIINEGRVVAEDSPENLSERLQSSEKFTIQLDVPPETALPVLEKVEGVNRVIPEKSSGDKFYNYSVETVRKKDLRKEIAKVVVENGWGLYELRPHGMSLEEVFLRLTTKEEEVEAS